VAHPPLLPITAPWLYLKIPVIGRAVPPITAPWLDPKTP